MGVLSQYELQKSLFTLLSADSTLSAMIAGVYDAVPAGAEYPYVTIGDIQARDWSSATTVGMQYQVVIRCYSRQGGRKEALNILDRIHALLHDANPSVTGYQCVLLRYVLSDVALNGDGLTYEGIMRFNALVQDV